MASPDVAGAPALPRRVFTEHAVFGMGVFVFTEVMLFAAFLSAFLIVRNSTPPGSWPPEGQPRLPFENTAVNTAALLASGALMFAARRAWRRGGPEAARAPFGFALLLGAAFVGLQGSEWAGLLRQGLTLTSSQIGSFFYLVIGAHALHAVVALVALSACWFQLRAGRLTLSRFGAWHLFWSFVVLMWPVLWLVVYR